MRPSPIAVLAKAPVAGFAKTRLIPAIGAHAAAILQERLTEHAVATTVAADCGPVTLYCAPDTRHASFRALAARYPIALAEQPAGDLGARMLAGLRAGGLLIGCDCPAFTPDHLRAAGAALDEADVVLTPAEDGGYVLIGMRTPHPELFNGMSWGAPEVLAETRKRIAALNLR
ncbi:MAG: TIGR04282 family arsenosugar biosynthesis glycosyltransferase, partial [Pseudolabrys sp.]